MIKSINLAGTSQGGAATDEKAKVSANDTTAGFLNGKLVAGTNVTLTENNNGGDETLTISADGVTGFTPSQNTASPNNTVNASRLLVDAGATNADAVVQPKGTGAFQLQLADGTAAGGNKRGAGAVDLQTLRTSASSVASGNRSAIIGGQDNTASGVFAIAGGFACNASANYSIALGQESSASGLNSVSIGLNTSASSTSAVAFGERAAANRYGMFAHASGCYTNTGDAQYERYTLRRATTNATPAELSCDGAAPATATRIGIANDSTYAFEALVVARRTDADNESAGYKITGVIDNNAGTTALVGTPTVTILAEDTAAWDIAVTADNTNDALVFTVTGENAKTIRWVATVHLTKVSG